VRIAILGCIHANLPALQAVLADASAQGAQRIVCAGDIVGWGPQPREALALLQGRGIPSIRGHDDRRVVDLALDRGRGEGAGGPMTVRWTLERLDEESVRALASLPLSYGFEESGHTVVVVHGTPRDEDETLPPDAPERRLEAFLLLAGANVLACAHGHQPFVREVGGGRLVLNAGSVGRSFDGDPRASYVLLELERDAPAHAEVRRVVYDARAALEAAEAAGAPRRVQAELRTRWAGLARGPDACGLVVTAPHRGGRSLRRLARAAIGDAARLLARASRDRDDPVEATHDARVATRRLFAAVDLFGAMIPEGKAASTVEALRAIRKRLGRVRDADVALELLESATSESPDAPGAAVAREALVRDREERERDRVRGLALARRKGLHRKLKKLARYAGESSGRGVAERLTEIAAAARSALDDALADGARPEALHAFRVAVKRLRYALEAAAAIDPAADALARTLAEVQDAIGEGRDRAALARRLGEEARRLETEGRAALSHAVAALAAHFHEEGVDRDAAFRAEGPGPRVLAALAIGADAVSPSAVAAPA
jgi:CHAD domain-containing protein/predicted phosphodiesterase